MRLPSFIPPAPNPTPAWQEVSPGTGEFTALLNVIPEAAAVIDRTSRRVVIGNQLFWDMLDGDKHPSTQILLDQFLPDFGEGWSSGEERETEIILPRGKRMPAWASITWLDKSGRWLLLRMVSMNVRIWKETQARREENLLAVIETLAGLNTQTNLDDALQLLLETGARMLAATELCIYRANLKQHTFLRLKSYGSQMEALPETLPLDEPSSEYSQWVWNHNRRPTTKLQQAASALGFSSLIAVPIQYKNNRLGLLTVANLPHKDAHRQIKTLKILAEYVSSALNFYVTLEQLQQTNRKYRQSNAIREAIWAYSVNGMILLSPTLSILTLSAAAELMLGYNNREVIGKPVEDILVGVNNLPSALRLACQGVITPDLGNIKIHRRSGQVFPAHLQVISAQANGEISNIILLIQDLSEYEKNHALTEQLEQRAFLGEVTAIFAHEVRNPINNISTGLQLMDINLPTDDANHNLIERMQGDCNRLTHLMDSVLNFSKSMEYKLIPTQPGELIKRLIERWKPRMSQLNINPVFISPDNLPPILGDGRALEQVFTNLFSNALNAMQEKGGTLAIKLEKIEIANGHFLISISISDTGVGIAPENLEQIFQPFFTTSQQGTGLGLAITKRIVMAHKGTIRVNSFTGGTVFTLLFPAAESEPR